MKKLKTIMAVVFIGIMLVSVNSCKKTVDDLTPGANCDDLANAYVAALNTYSLDPSVSNCESFVDALRDYADGCATLTPAQRQELNDEIDAIDCSQ